MTDGFTGALKLRTSLPELPPRFLQRPRLDSIFARGSQGPATIVCAGAGYGKTLAVAAWIHGGELPGPVAWLTIDHAYDVRGFWTDLLDALRICEVLPDTGSLWEMAPGPRFGAPQLDLIVEALTQLPDPVVLVLDDFQYVQNTQVLDFLSRVVECRIPQLRLVLMTRTEPLLRLSRLRLAEQVTEINADDLAFTAMEAHQMCVLGGHTLVDHDLADLLRRTQGWPVGLRLALITLNDPHTAPDDGLGNFGGSNRRVAAYLLEEVLDQLSASDRRFLLATSVADQMTAELARQLTGRADSRQVLETLVARNALTVRLSDRPNWFRYHPFLRELLRDRLAAENPDSVFELNRRAADWYAAENEPITAIRHYCLARDWPAVLRVLGAAPMPLFLSPQASALASALAMADAEAALRPTVSTLVAATVCAYQRHDFESMARHTTDASLLLVGDDDPEPAAVILIAISRMVQARISAPGAVVGSARRLIELVDDLPRQRVPAAATYGIIAAGYRAIGLVLEGQLDEARLGLSAARTGAAHLGSDWLELAATSYLSLALAMAGDSIRARARSAGAMNIAARRGWINEPQRHAAVAAAALTHLQAYELDAAQECLDAASSSALPDTDIGSRMIMDITAVGVSIARRDVRAARGRLRRLAEEQSGAGQMTDLLRRWSRVAHAEVSLLADNPHDALAMVDDPGAATDYAAAIERITRAKAFLALADPAGALAALGPADGFDGYRVQATEAAVVESIALRRLHRDAAAMARFADAVALAEPMTLITPFISTDPQLAAQLIRHEHLTGTPSDFVRRLMATAGSPTPAPAVPRGVPESLTERELAVLQYLPTVLRASDIADDLFVSVNTVKTHLRGIYNKLGVSSRREAVQQARYFELL